MIYDIKKPFPNKGLKELRTLACAAFVTGIVLHSCAFKPAEAASHKYNMIGSYKMEGKAPPVLSFDKKCSILEHFHYSGHPGCYLFLKHGHTKFCIPRNEVKLCA